MNTKLLKAAVTIARAYLLPGEKKALPKSVVQDLADGLADEGIPWSVEEEVIYKLMQHFAEQDADLYTVVVGMQMEDGFATKTIVGPAPHPLDALAMSAKIVHDELVRNGHVGEPHVVPVAIYKGKVSNLLEDNEEVVEAMEKYRLTIDGSANQNLA